MKRKQKLLHAVLESDCRPSVSIPNSNRGIMQNEFVVKKSKVAVRSDLIAGGGAEFLCRDNASFEFHALDSHLIWVE